MTNAQRSWVVGALWQHVVERAGGQHPTGPSPAGGLWCVLQPAMCASHTCVFTLSGWLISSRNGGVVPNLPLSGGVLICIGTAVWVSCVVAHYEQCSCVGEGWHLKSLALSVSRVLGAHSDSHALACELYHSELPSSATSPAFCRGGSGLLFDTTWFGVSTVCEQATCGCVTRQPGICSLRVLLVNSMDASCRQAILTKGLGHGCWDR